MSQISELQALALQVVQDRRKNTYSVSRIYNAYNLIFNKRETPQTCASCLLKRAKEIEKWYAESIAEPAPEPTEDGLRVADVANNLGTDAGALLGAGEPAKDVGSEDDTKETYNATNKKGEAVVIVFDADAETATDAEGKDLPAGTYNLENGDKIAVQVGGKATYKADLV